MELAGLEPAASWVRCSGSGATDLRDLQALYNAAGVVVVPGIAADIGRYSSIQALLAMSA